MDAEYGTLAVMKQPWVSNRTAQNILRVLHFAYPLIILFFFLTTFTVRSILTAGNDNTDENPAAEPVGPGGKPLPKKAPPKKKDVLDFSRSRKLLFEWLSLGVALTLLGNSITVIVHALYAREEQWWCGQAAVVSMTHTPRRRQKSSG